MTVVEDQEWFKSEGVGKARREQLEIDCGLVVKEVENLLKEGSGKKGEDDAGVEVVRGKECTLECERNVYLTDSTHSSIEVQKEVESVEKKAVDKENVDITMLSGMQMLIKEDVSMRSRKFLGVRRHFYKGEFFDGKNNVDAYVFSLPSDEEENTKAIILYNKKEVITEVTEKLESMKLNGNAEDELQAEKVKHRRLTWGADGERKGISLFSIQMKREEQKRKRVKKKAVDRRGKGVRKIYGKDVLNAPTECKMTDEETVSVFLENVRRMMAEGEGSWPITTAKNHEFIILELLRFRGSLDS